jgi:hypothetical protein
MRWALLALLLLCQQDTELLLLRPQMQYPTALHSAVWEMVEGCTGRKYDGELQWAVADTIVGHPSGVMSYGVLIRRSDASPIAVIERAHWLNPGVLSHELVHLVGNGDEDSPAMRRCVMRIGVDMPIRTMSPEQLASVRERATIVRYEEPNREGL